MKRPILLGLGGNAPGKAGIPAIEMRQSVAMLASYGCEIKRVSSLYVSSPVGGGRQALFLNAALAIVCSFTPLQLLRIAKDIEREAGRRKGRRNGPRPLDIDILDFGGRVLNADSERQRPRLVLPHPMLHLRRFALLPMLEICPAWQHPRLHRGGRALLARLSPASGAVQRILDSSWITCDQYLLERSTTGIALRVSARAGMDVRPARQKD